MEQQDWVDLKQTAEELVENIPCRRQQIELLLALFGQRTQQVVPGIFLYGHSASGKSLVLNAILGKLQVPHVLVNCVECYTSRLIYERILDGLSNTIPSPSNMYTHYARCDNMNDFVRLLKALLSDDCEDGGRDTVYLVFENAERLRYMDLNLLPAFLRLQELTGHNICVILETEIVLDKFKGGNGYLEPYPVHFPDYNKDDQLEIMCLDCPSEYPPGFYKNYCNLLLSVFHVACRNLGELRHLALLNFPKYVDPVVKGEANIDDMRKLWRNIEPHLKKALQTVYLREVSSSQWERMQQEASEGGEDVQIQGMSARSNIELPFYSKYLLIAAYLASYNPAKMDKRFFAKNAGKMRRGQVAAFKKKERTNSQLLGPKPFPLDRLMAIFYSIVEGRVAPTANIFSQITSLCTLSMLSPVASNDQLETPKYKCTVSLDLVKGVARTVNFEVMRYLYDFL